MISIKNVTKGYENGPIIEHINLDIEDGGCVVIIGGSGCGKSTLLRMIAGLESVSQGNIVIGDKVVNDVAPKDRDIAMVFQSYALYPHLNVKENISLGLKVRHVAKCEIERRVERAAEILKLEEYLTRKPKELSGGQRQRVALARAIVREPKVFLMDEPLSNLDAKLRCEMRTEIKKLHNRLKTTFIYVTHDQTEALTMGDRIVVLNEGNVEQVDTPDNIYNNPANTYVATFMGTNPMNLIEGEIQNGFLKFGTVTIDMDSFILNTDKKKVIVGVRPEKIATLNNPEYHFNQIRFSADVVFEENLGSHRNVYFEFGDKQFCAVVDASVEKSKTLDFSIDPKDLKFFDVNSKKLIK